MKAHFSPSAAILVSLLLAFVGGCTSDLDRKMMAARQQYHAANQVFGAACGTFVKGYDHLAESKHDLQRDSIRDKWALWIGKHTDANGNLVSKYENGAIGPMSAAFLAEAIDSREKAMLELAADSADTAEFARRYSAAIGVFMAQSDKIMQAETDAQAAKESAQAVLDAALAAVGGVAGGFGIGVAAVP